MSSKHFHKLKVSNIERLTTECVAISLEVPSELSEIYKFESGQYLTFEKEIKGDTLRRSYSICSAPSEGILKVAVKSIPSGRFSNYANAELKIGDTLEVMHPMGNFTYRPKTNSQEQFVFFAAGSGITPVLSHIKNILTHFPLAQVILFYGNGNSDSIIFKNELESLKSKYIKRFALYHILSKEKSGVPLFAGRIDHEKCLKFSKVFFNIDDVTAYFLCGPSEMIFGIKDTLIALGVSQSSIHFELFNTDNLQVKTDNVRSEEQIDPSLESKISIKLDGDRIDFSLRYGEKSILDAALAHGADLPYACKGGVCSTCKAKVVKGEVKMDLNYALEADELAAGFVLTCQAHPRTAEVVIDFDQK